MKVLIDENLSPALAKALNALFAGKHEIVHIRERFGPRVRDVDWIDKLSGEGRWLIISGDRRITKNRTEYSTFRNSNLVGFFLSKGLNKSPTVKQMERILALWSAMETQSGIVQGGAMFELPSTSTKIRQI